MLFEQVFQCCWVNQIFAVCEEMLSWVTKAAGSDTIQMGSAYSNLVSENITHTDPWLWSAHIFMSSGEGFDSLHEPFAGQLTFGQNEHASRFAACFFKQTHRLWVPAGDCFWWAQSSVFIHTCSVSLTCVLSVVCLLLTHALLRVFGALYLSSVHI